MARQVALIKVIGDLSRYLPSPMEKYILGVEVLAEVYEREVVGQHRPYYEVDVKDIIEAISPAAPLIAEWFQNYCRRQGVKTIVFPLSFVKVIG